LALALIIIGCGSPYGLSTTAAEITLGDVSVTLVDAVSCSCSGTICFSSAVDAAKVTWFGFCVPISTGLERMASNYLNTSISAMPTLLALFFKMPRKLPISLIIALVGVTTGCVR
jgi:hypothetical protein